MYMVLYSEFDIQEHKKTYTDYLEVIIHASGKVEYAVPSHQEKLIRIACDQRKISRDELNDMCPEEYYFDFMTWLCEMTCCVSVWNNFIMYAGLTHEQRDTLLELKAEGLYTGNIPEVTIC